MTDELKINPEKFEYFIGELAESRNLNWSVASRIREDFRNGKLDFIDHEKKVKIPKFVAEWLEIKKKNNDSLHVAIDGDWQIMPETMKEWLGVEFNDAKFARAWLDGYEVEEEPKYYIKLHDFCYIELFSPKEQNVPCFTIAKDFAGKFTIGEIKEQDERYLDFKEPVERGLKNEIL